MNPTLLRALLAGLPLLGLALDLRSGILYGGAGLLILFVTSLCFFALRPMVPERFYRLSFLIPLFLLGLGGIGFLKETMGYPALLLPASLTLLTPPDFFRKQRSWKRLMRKNLLSGFYFWIFLAGHGALSEALREGLGLHFAGHPAGSFFLLGMAMIFLPDEVKR